jgi:bacterioferritin-associated ferredoxin
MEKQDKIQKLIICRCEEVTEAEIRRAVRDGAHTIGDVKRRTRAGMGLCQGHTCSRLVAGIIAEETGIPLSEILPATVRPPLRPLAARILTSDKTDRVN